MNKHTSVGMKQIRSCVLPVSGSAMSQKRILPHSPMPLLLRPTDSSMTFTPFASLTLLHIDFVNIFSNGILSICGLQVSLFIDHVVRSCDNSIAANVDLIHFITSIKKMVERFRSTFGTTYKDYVETCSTSTSEDDNPLVSI